MKDLEENILWEEIKKNGPYGIDFSHKFDKISNEFERRDFFTHNYGWSVPNEESIREIKEFINGDRIIEVGAGYGLWARLLQDIGVNIFPTNKRYKSKQDEKHIPHNIQFTKVEKINNLKALEKYGDFEVLMMSWPPYSGSMAYNSLKAFKGNKLIFIGEGQGGCTGCDKFFKLLYRKWERVKEVSIPQWMGMHDELFLYKRE